MSTKTCRVCGHKKPVGPDGEFYARHKMRDGYSNHCKQCHAEMGEARRKANPGREREMRAAWRASRVTSPSSPVAAKRRARIKAGDRVSLRAVLERDGMTCGICHAPIEDERLLDYDHIIPLARGGEHTLENLQPSHRRCNGWKGDRLPEEMVGLSPPQPGAAWDEIRIVEKRNAKKSASQLRRFANMTPEQKSAWQAKRAAGMTPDAIAARSASVKAAWAAKTPEELEAWRARCRSVKAGSPGNAANLAKGHTPEVRAKAIAASAELRRGVALPEEQKKAIAEGLARAYASGMRKAGHSEETKAKISATKRRKAFWKASRDWLMRPRASEAAAPSSAPTA